MDTIIIDGKATAATIKAEIAERVNAPTWLPYL